MNEQSHNLESDNKAQEVFERESIEIARFAEAQIAEIDTAVDNFVAETKELEDRANSPKEKARLKVKQEELKSLATRAKEAIYFYTRLVVLGGILLKPGDAHISEHHHDETLDEQIHRAKVEMATRGITDEQRGAYKPIITDVIHRAIYPLGYWDMEIGEMPKRILFGRKKIAEKTREDAWALYLGLPQRSDTFSVSDYRPTRSVESKYYFSINNFFGTFLSYRNIKLSQLIVSLEADGGKRSESDTAATNIMRTFELSLGKDERGPYVAYYDKWDLDIFPENNKGFFGKPFEIYDRLYYDPVTFEPVESMSRKS